VTSNSKRCSRGRGSDNWAQHRSDGRRHESSGSGNQRREIGVALGDPLKLGDPNHDVQARQRHAHLMGHERAELGQAEIVAVGFVEDLLGGVEGVGDESGRGRLEAYLLEAGKAELRTSDVVALRIEGSIERRTPIRELN
jgi:hypothetical protein